MTWHSSAHEGRVPTPISLYLNDSVCCVTNPSRALAPQQTLFGLTVTEAVLSAAQADTLQSLASGFAQSELWDRSSHFSVAGRHLHHMRLELHGRGWQHAEGYPLAPNCHANMYRTPLCTQLCARWEIHRALNYVYIYTYIQKKVMFPAI